MLPSLESSSPCVGDQPISKKISILPSNNLSCIQTIIKKYPKTPGKRTGPNGNTSQIFCSFLMSQQGIQSSEMCPVSFMFPIKAALPIPFTASAKRYGALGPFTHLLRQMGSSRGKTTFPSLLFLSLDNEETNPHLVTNGLKPSFVPSTSRSPAHVSLPWRTFLRGARRGAEGALPPAHRH